MLRLAVGTTAAFDGVAYSASPEAATRGTVLVAVMLTLAGVALIAGWFTPAAGVLLTAGELCRILAIVPVHGLDLLQGDPAILLRASVALALTMLGPGAHSIDAYVFGRREITIPNR